jgi:hypothetical protein
MAGSPSSDGESGRGDCALASVVDVDRLAPTMNKRPLFSLLASCARSVVTLASIAVLTGCGAETKIDAKSAHDTGHGTVRDYEGTYDQIWAAAHAAISWNEVGTPTDHPDEHYLITDPAKFDQIGIWLEPSGTKSKVSVVVIDDPTLPGPNEEGVQKDISTALAQIKAGKPTDKRP